MRPLFHVGLAFMEGGIEYGPYNYRIASILLSVYYNAALRHLAAFWEGEEIDPKSGIPHLAKVAANMLIMLDCMQHGNADDDRPPPSVTGWMDEVNALAEKFNARKTK